LEAFRLSGGSGEKDGLPLFEDFGNLAMIFFRVRQSPSPKGMEAALMVTEVHNSEQTCFVVFCQAAVEC
jgi:hypothetical protein